ncbi:Anthranilate synthase component I [Desulfonema limicola]|uniref:aminodeoxychorismate synthase n=1 Tax=Desulfonema limicola TaxID=45656 RepID=A0A975B3J9_9BACT|nr:aminodeoxychorismate synthase component I [Desulfonema limicola]QTA78126.1 Anthranilate synthase component I [Desulfonema limicola]
MYDSLDKIKHIIGSISKLDIEKIDLQESFFDFAARFAHLSGTVLLMSGGNHDCSNYHILGIKPWLRFYGRNQNMSILLSSDKQCRGHTLSHRFEADPFDTLRQIINLFNMDNLEIPFPLASGLMGYLSYDLKDCLEKLPKTSIDDLCLPHIWFMAPSAVIVHDKKKNTTHACIPYFKGAAGISQFNGEFIKKIYTQVKNPEAFYGNPDGFKSNFTRPVYLKAVEKIKDYISAGHVYQVNMSQRFEMDFSGDAFALFQSLYKLNPAPFFAYINAGDHQIVSTSPERFIMQNNKYVETRPIKGTRARGKTPYEDKLMAQELEQSKKDDAELSMIVDLMRNDIGKVCKPGSVRVVEHKRLEPYQNVWHLVSIVEGVLDNDKDCVDLIKAGFPGGSITGCPKIRSMEIIDELEPNRRHIYTGSIGYLSFHNTMDLSIAIRTATIYNGKIIFSVGGGIVFDSDPEDEYEETLHKGLSLTTVFQGNQTESHGFADFAWFNGNIKPVKDIKIPVSHPGVQYGYGFFETIRIDNGMPVYLQEHISRFSRAWNHFFQAHIHDLSFPDLSWDEIISQVIIKNRLEKGIAAVKIMALLGDREIPPFNNSLVVSARPYIHRLALTEKKGLDLVSFPFARQTPAADYKTLNYLYCLQAGKYAKKTGADEALIMNPDQTVSETNTANILLLNNKKVTVPISPHVLPGVMAQAVCDYLLISGYEIKREKVKIQDLFNADMVILTNSLIGAVPVLSLDQKTLTPHDLVFDLCKQINARVL